MRSAIIILLVTICIVFIGCTPDPFTFPLDEALANGKPTLAEFGGTNCAPCKAMWPVLKELSREYSSTFNVVIVDVAKNQDLADRYNIKMIPMQAYFDKSGMIIKTHLGGVTREDILKEFRDMGVDTLTNSDSQEN
jgi:thioredoxin-like negative regulator of GroEL